MIRSSQTALDAVLALRPSRFQLRIGRRRWSAIRAKRTVQEALHTSYAAWVVRRYRPEIRMSRAFARTGSKRISTRPDGCGETMNAPLVALLAAETHGTALFAQACALDLEGIVAKRMDAPYRAGRQDAWRKIRNYDYWREAALRFRR
jgi:hypothetical protein